MEKIKILMVDDEEGVLKVVRTVLQNHCLITETSPVIAAERVKQEKFDIYIVDYQMSADIDGLTLLDIIHQQRRSKDYVTIFLTSHGTMYLFQKEKDRGLFDFYVEKPFEVDDFMKVFDRAIVKLEERKSEID